MAKNSVAGLLTSVDSIFTTQEERNNAQRSYLTDIPTAEIGDFPNHPFHVRMDEEMERLVDSVKERGVLSPVLVRPMPDGGYQMVSGHRRKRAAELAELPTLSCIVRELTDDEATIIMVDSNLQREKVLPSEKAFAGLDEPGVLGLEVARLVLRPDKAGKFGHRRLGLKTVDVADFGDNASGVDLADAGDRRQSVWDDFKLLLNGIV